MHLVVLNRVELTQSFIVIASSAGSSPSSTSTACAHNLRHSNASKLTLRTVHVRLLCTPPASVSPTRAQLCVQQSLMRVTSRLHLTASQSTIARSDRITRTTSSTRCQRIHESRARLTSNPTHGHPHRRGRTPTSRAAGAKDSAQAACYEDAHLRRPFVHYCHTSTQKSCLGT
jgi:hypothetical protein